MHLLFVVSYLIAGMSPHKSIGARREQVPFSMAIENGEETQYNECRFYNYLLLNYHQIKWFK